MTNLASADPTPGGGSAAAHTGAAAAALVTMVGRVTVGKKKYVSVEPQMFTMIETVGNLRQQLTSAVEEDASSFEGYLAATRLPKNTPEEIELRQVAMDAATRNAAIVPYKVSQIMLGGYETGKNCSRIGEYQCHF